MANSLRAKLSKLRHDGHITDAEYQAFIKKLDGHDREIRNKAIDEMQGNLIRNSRTEVIDGKVCLIVTEKRIKQIAEQMKGVQR